MLLVNALNEARAEKLQSRTRPVRAPPLVSAACRHFSTACLLSACFTAILPNLPMAAAFAKRSFPATSCILATEADPNSKCLVVHPLPCHDAQPKGDDAQCPHPLLESGPSRLEARSRAPILIPPGKARRLPKLCRRKRTPNCPGPAGGHYSRRTIASFFFGPECFLSRPIKVRPGLLK